MKSNGNKWYKRWIELADHIASWSPDRGTKCGSVAVSSTGEEVLLATGYNGFPRGIASDPDAVPERWDRTDGVKYQWVEHAERNCIYNAARSGVSLWGATMYLNYAVECCSDCTRAIIQSGISRVVGPNRPFPGKGAGKHYHTDDIPRNMMEEAGIEVVHVDMEKSEYSWMTYIPEDERA